MMKISHVNAVTPAGILENASLEISDGIITHIVPETAPAPEERWAVPAFVDLHIHGMGGVGPEQGTPEALLQLSNVLARQGVAAFCPTLYCARPETMARQLKALAPAMGKETGAQMLGFHLEGPFISPDKPGVMKPHDIAAPDLNQMRQIYEAAGGKISIMTLAPELPGMEPVIEFCRQHHIIMQAGHTNATYAQVQQVFDKGVRRVTHLGNAMRGLHQREPGVLGAALMKPEISCEVIADGKHVHPALLTFLKQVKPIAQITAVTDALLPTGQAHGPFFANGEGVALQDGVWKRVQDGVTAGSALTMAGAFRQLLAAGYTWPEAARCTSTNAAQLVRFAGGVVQENAPAYLVVLDTRGHIRQIVLYRQQIL